MKAFLFGGDSNGKVFEIENHRQYIDMPKDMQYVSYNNDNEKPFSAMYNAEKYIKYTEKFRKKLSNSGAVIEMEDLGIFIHESFKESEIESLSKIILMVIRAQWNPVKGYLNDY